MSNPYAKGLDRNAANYEALTPVSFLAKAAAVYQEAKANCHVARTSQGKLPLLPPNLP